MTFFPFSAEDLLSLMMLLRILQGAMKGKKKEKKKKKICQSNGNVYYWHLAFIDSLHCKRQEWTIKPYWNFDCIS